MRATLKGQEAVAAAAKETESWMPVAAVAKYCKLSSLKQYGFILPQFWSLEV